MKVSLFIAALLCLANLALADFKAGSMTFNGGYAGGDFKVGQTIHVGWVVEKNKDPNFDIFKCSDGGHVFILIKKGFQSKSDSVDFPWVVDSVNQHGRIRVCQPAGGRTCTDSDMPDQTGPPFVLQSSKFTSEGPLSAVISSPRLMAEGMSLRFISGNSNLKVLFSLPNGGDQRRASDARGRFLIPNSAR